MHSREGLPPWLDAAVLVAQWGAFSLTLEYSDAEGLWEASMSGPGEEESWRAKDMATAPDACRHLVENILSTTTPNDLSRYQEWLHDRMGRDFLQP
jgi:hypothetical protein